MNGELYFDANHISEIGNDFAEIGNSLTRFSSRIESVRDYARRFSEFDRNGVLKDLSELIFSMDDISKKLCGLENVLIEISDIYKDSENKVCNLFDSSAFEGTRTVEKKKMKFYPSHIWANFSSDARVNSSELIMPEWLNELCVEFEKFERAR